MQSDFGIVLSYAIRTGRWRATFLAIDKIFGEVEARSIRTRLYYEYLKSEQWGMVRARTLLRVDHRCDMCGGIAVNVHHKTYDRTGAESDEDLQPLCRQCHLNIHGIDEIAEGMNTVLAVIQNLVPQLEKKVQ